MLIQTPNAISGATPADVNELGRTLATLNDWRAIAIILIFVIVVLLAERGLAGWRQGVERKHLLTLAEKFASNSDKVAGSLAQLSQEVAIMSAVSSRMESTASKSHGPTG